jgi:site-specific recombinase XerD
MPGKRLTVVAGTKPSPLRQAAADFLASVRAHGRSPRTEEYYDAVLSRVFLPWAEQQGVTDLQQLDQRALDRWSAALLGDVSPRTGKALAKASAASYVRAVRRFLSWAQKADMAPKDVAPARIAAKGKKLDVMSREEIARMESAAAAERDKLIIRLLGDCGLRLNELLTLEPDRLVEDGRDRYIKVLGKGDKERLVPVKPAVFLRLKRYAEKGRPADAYTSKVFISLRRRPETGGYEALDPRAVQVMLKAVAKKAGITKPVNPHAFRHSMVTNSLRAGANPLLLAKVVGHADLTMIQNTYSHLVASDAHREMMRILAED